MRTFFKHVRLLFNRIGWRNQFPDPLSLWERARVRESHLWCRHFVVVQASCLHPAGQNLGVRPDFIPAKAGIQKIVVPVARLQTIPKGLNMNSRG